MIRPKIAKSNQFHNNFTTQIRRCNLEAFGLLYDLCVLLKRAKHDVEHERTLDSMMLRMTADYSVVSKTLSRKMALKAKQHLNWLEQCGVVIHIGSRKSWLYMVNPMVFNKLLISQRHEYESDWKRYHSFPYLNITSPAS